MFIYYLSKAQYLLLEQIIPQRFLLLHTVLFFFLLIRLPPKSTLFPYTTLFRSGVDRAADRRLVRASHDDDQAGAGLVVVMGRRSEEHTSELQSQFHIVCRLLLEKKNTNCCNK